MKIYNVPLREGPQEFTIALSGIVYGIKVRFNARTGLWVLDITDENGDSLIRNLPMVTGCDLLAQYRHLGIGGALVVVNAGKNDDSTPGFDELPGALLYVTGLYD